VTLSDHPLARWPQDSPLYPQRILPFLADRAPAAITCKGNPSILNSPALALFCSAKCPGKLILATYDLAQQWRQAGTTIISGFHSPMERECLNVLLRGSGSLILCPARSLTRLRLRAELRQPSAKGRLLFLSPFSEKVRRASVETALYRNQFVAALADAIFVAYADRGSKTEVFCRQVLAWGKSLYTLRNEANAPLLDAGAKPYPPLPTPIPPPPSFSRMP